MVLTSFLVKWSKRACLFILFSLQSILAKTQFWTFHLAVWRRLKRGKEEFPPGNIFFDDTIILWQPAAIKNLPQLQERMIFAC